MILTLVLLVCLAFSLRSGYKRGLVYQLYLTGASLLALLSASFIYDHLSKSLNQWVQSLLGEQTFNQLLIFSGIQADKIIALVSLSISFGLVYGLIKLILRVLGLIFLAAKRITSFGKVGRILAVILSFLVTYFNLQLVLTILATLPINELQHVLAGSPLAQLMMTQTPIISNFLYKLFISLL